MAANRLSDWSTLGSECGWSGCRGTEFWTTSKRYAWARWDLGDVQGTYELRVRHPNDLDGSQPTARLRFEVQEKRAGGSWTTVKKSYTTQSRSKTGWRTFSKSVELDGQARVKVTVLSGYAAVSDVGLKQTAMLPEHKDLAKTMCKQGVVNAWTRLWVGYGITVAAVGSAWLMTTYGVAGLTARGQQILLTEAARLGSTGGGYVVAKEVVKKKALSLLSSIWNDSIEGWQYPCRNFKDYSLAPVNLGHGQFANDIAEIWANRRT